MVAYETTLSRIRRAYYWNKVNGNTDSDDSDDEETPRAQYPTLITRRGYRTHLYEALTRTEDTSRTLYTEGYAGIFSLHKRQDLDIDELSQLVELLYIYADSACDLLNSCSRPAPRTCYKFFHKLINRAMDINTKFNNLRTRSGNIDQQMYNYFDNDLLDPIGVLERYRAPGCVSLYNDQAIRPLGPYQHNVDDARHTTITARAIDPAVTNTLPRQVAFPDSIVHSLVNSEPINDTTAPNTRRTLHTLLADHSELFDARENLARTQNPIRLDSFDVTLTNVHKYLTHSLKINTTIIYIPTCLTPPKSTRSYLSVSPCQGKHI